MTDLISIKQHFMAKGYHNVTYSVQDWQGWLASAWKH